jgi:L-ascorbate metabolism protein UlaG (beta-lactamase superfamily)
MNTDNITINTQSSIKMVFDKTIYFDPFKIENNYNDADIIFITHNHYDHMDINSIYKVKNDNTIIIAPVSMQSVIEKISFKKYVFLNPFDEVNIDNVFIKTIPAYNINKEFHPRNNNWLGYIVTINGITYYIAGDTDKTKEAESIKCDIALLPIGGHFTMNKEEASELTRIISPKIVIPTHYGSIIGDKSFGKEFKELLSDTNIMVIEKLEE